MRQLKLKKKNLGSVLLAIRRNDFLAFFGPAGGVPPPVSFSSAPHICVILLLEDLLPILHSSFWGNLVSASNCHKGACHSHHCFSIPG